MERILENRGVFRNPARSGCRIQEYIGLVLAAVAFAGQQRGEIPEHPETL